MYNYIVLSTPTAFLYIFLHKKINSDKFAFIRVMSIIITVQRTRDNDRGASPQVRRKPYSYPRTRQSFLENFTLR